MDKKSVFPVLMGYVIWGVQPLYWNLTSHMDSMFMLCCRIVWSVIFTVSILAITKRLPALKAVFKDKKVMKYLAPAAFFLLVDWGLFIYAVTTGKVLDTSLGYYMGPMVVFGMSMILFKEKPTKLMLVAMGLAVTGVVVSAVQYGRVPVLSLVLAFMFAIYGALKKYAQVDSTISIAAESLMMTPLAVLFVLFFRMGDNGIAALTWYDQLLIIGSGVITALPMMLYSLGVLKLPFIMLGFMQYISPTFSMICGLFMGETLTPDKLTTFAFIWLALALYMVSMVLDERKKKKVLQTTEESVCEVYE